MGKTREDTLALIRAVHAGTHLPIKEYETEDDVSKYAKEFESYPSTMIANVNRDLNWYAWGPQHVDWLAEHCASSGAPLPKARLTALSAGDELTEDETEIFFDLLEMESGRFVSISRIALEDSTEPPIYTVTLDRTHGQDGFTAAFGGPFRTLEETLSFAAELEPLEEWNISRFPEEDILHALLNRR